MASGSKPDCLSYFFSLVMGILVWEHNSIIIITLIGPQSVWTNNQYSRLWDALYAELTLPRISVPEEKREVWKHLHFVNKLSMLSISSCAVRSSVGRSTLKKYLCRSSAHFLIGLLGLWHWSEWVVSTFLRSVSCGSQHLPYFLPSRGLSYFVYGFLGCANGHKLD